MGGMGGRARRPAGRKAALLIDGGALRARCHQQQRPANSPDYIERVALACFDGDEEDVFRVFYYDCAPFSGDVRLPNGNTKRFVGSDDWQHQLAQRNFFALRRGRLKLARIEPPTPGLADDEYSPVFLQKGVDMRIGLDMATLATKREVERVILLTADTDFVPAMKLVRTEGLQVVVVDLPGSRFNREFLEHVDLRRKVEWPPVVGAEAGTQA